MPLAHGLMFHHFHGDAYGVSQGSISAGDLERMIDFVGRERILNADEWMRRIANGTLPRDALCITFDDTLRCQYDIAAPVLAAHGITAFWFAYTSVLDGGVEMLEIYRHFRHQAFGSVDAFYDAFFAAVAESEWGVQTTEALEGFDPAAYKPELAFYTDQDRRFRFLRGTILGNEAYEGIMMGMLEDAGFDWQALTGILWLTEDHLRDLCDNGHEIGLHSHSHPIRVEHLSADGQKREYGRNYEILHGITGRRPSAMSHPCNSYNGDTLDVLKALNIELGFRADLSFGAEASKLEQPRDDHSHVMRRMRAA